MTRKKQGICLTCMHFTKCALPTADCSTGGIQYCEEYRTVCLAPVVVTDEKTEKIHQTPSAIPGLCGNCKHSSYCSFPRPEAGVWHCEDYQ